jgi:hypothetical protein
VVERNLAKVDVVGSNPIIRFIKIEIVKRLPSISDSNEMEK